MHRGLSSLAELNAWERQHITILKTISGRDLYFSIIRHFFQPADAPALPLKSFSVNQTDRATRLRIREFAEEGLLVVHMHEEDSRSRSITPTAKLYALFEKHSLATAAAFAQRFHFVSKGN